MMKKNKRWLEILLFLVIMGLKAMKELATIQRHHIENQIAVVQSSVNPAAVVLPALIATTAEHCGRYFILSSSM